MNSLNKPPLPRHDLVTEIPELYCINYFSCLKKIKKEEEHKNKIYTQKQIEFEQKLNEWIVSNN